MKTFRPDDTYLSFALGFIVLNGYLSYYRFKKKARNGKVMKLVWWIPLILFLNFFYAGFSILSGYVPEEMREPIMRWLYK